MAKVISGTYGDALYDVAVEKHKEDELLSEATALLNVLDENPAFLSLMSHPEIIREEKLKIIEDVFKGRVSDEMTGFLYTVEEKGRFDSIREILEYFVEKIKELKGIGIAHIKTPMPLNDTQKKEVEKKLLDTTSYKEIEAEYSVDETLIGGMVIRIGDRVVDSSVSNKIEELKRQLLKVRV